MWRLILMFPFLTACPSGTRAQKEQTEEPCRKLYAQCKLPGGPLGVCNEAPCESGEVPPCLKCISQH
jgi:hypothetical protein